VYFFEPLRSDVRVVSVNALVLLALALALWATTRKKFLLAGAILALTVLFKPYVAMIFPIAYAVLILEKRWRDLRSHAIGAIAGGAIGVLLSAWRFHSLTIWLDWLRAVRSMPESSVTADLGNYALPAIFSIPPMIVGVAFLAIAIGVIAWLKTGNDESAIGLGVIVSFLGAPLVWPHYLLLTIPLIAVLVRSKERLAISAGVVALLLIAIVPWAFLPIPGARVEAGIVNTGLLVALAAAITSRNEFRESRAASEKESRGLPRTARSSRSRPSRKA